MAPGIFIIPLWNRSTCHPPFAKGGNWNRRTYHLPFGKGRNWNRRTYHPPLEKGGIGIGEPIIPPLEKGGEGGFKEQMLCYDKRLKKVSQHLRNNMTDAEKILWSKLRRKQLKGHSFYRQKILGKYIVDFYCPKANLVIELDGGQHYSETGRAKDSIREVALREMEICVLRFSDRDVFENLGAVIEEIWSCL